MTDAELDRIEQSVEKATPDGTWYVFAPDFCALTAEVRRLQRYERSIQSLADAELDRIKKDVLEIQEWNRVQKICCDGSVEKYSYDPEAYQQIDRLLAHIQCMIHLREEARP